MIVKFKGEANPLHTCQNNKTMPNNYTDQCEKSLFNQRLI